MASESFFLGRKAQNFIISACLLEKIPSEWVQTYQFWPLDLPPKFLLARLRSELCTPALRSHTFSLFSSFPFWPIVPTSGCLEMSRRKVWTTTIEVIEPLRLLQYQRLPILFRAWRKFCNLSMAMWNSGFQPVKFLGCRQYLNYILETCSPVAR